MLNIDTISGSYDICITFSPNLTYIVAHGKCPLPWLLIASPRAVAGLTRRYTGGLLAKVYLRAVSPWMPNFQAIPRRDRPRALAS